MKIDENPIMLEAIKEFKKGNKLEGRRIQDTFVEELRASTEDHCPCTVGCKFHGKCKECVAIHRGHTDHLPACMFNTVNKKLKGMLEITENSLIKEFNEKEAK